MTEQFNGAPTASELRKEGLGQRVRDVGRVFDLERVLQVDPSLKSIAKYYRVNRIPYSLFHTRRGFVHMGISRNGSYKEDDLLEQARIVDGFITQDDSKVLELATGRGANSIYLASKHPKASFYGIDLPNGQLDSAVDKGKKVKNFFPSEGDFHDLSRFDSETFDVVFVVESLCHSNSKGKVLDEAERVLKKGGVFIVIDGFSGKAEEQLTDEEKLAINLVAKGMMVPVFDYYESFMEEIKRRNFEIILEEDASPLIMPTLKKLERPAKKFFALPTFAAKTIVRSLPTEFTYNSISGYLMPPLINEGIAQYRIVAAKKC